MKLQLLFAFAIALALSACASKPKPPGVDMAAISKPLEAQGQTLQELKAGLQTLKQ
jgi:starvation-inducible outer membrane lipoprotein